MKALNINYEDYGDILFSKETQNQQSALQKTLLFLLPRVKRPFYLAVGLLAVNFLQILSISLPEDFPINSGLMPSVHFFLKVFNFNRISGNESNSLVFTAGAVNAVFITSFMILMIYHRKPKQMVIKKLALKACLFLTTIYEYILLIRRITIAYKWLT